MAGWKSQSYSINSNPSVEDIDRPAKPEQDAVSKNWDQRFGKARERTDQLKKDAEELAAAVPLEVWDEH